MIHWSSCATTSGGGCTIDVDWNVSLYEGHKICNYQLGVLVKLRKLPKFYSILHAQRSTKDPFLKFHIKCIFLNIKKCFNNAKQLLKWKVNTQRKVDSTLKVQHIKTIKPYKWWHYQYKDH